MMKLSYISYSYKNPWHQTMPHIDLWRCPGAEITYFKWATKLKHNENQAAITTKKDINQPKQVTLIH
jgi:hypothetical protein